MDYLTTVTLVRDAAFIFHIFLAHQCAAQGENRTNKIELDPQKEGKNSKINIAKVGVKILKCF